MRVPVEGEEVELANADGRWELEIVEAEGFLGVSYVEAARFVTPPGDAASPPR